jgi:pimeloyl-ACP methyl ester carboxylesterase
MKPETTAIILIHDSWLGAWEWNEVIEHLQERGWAAIALDLPGHGNLYREGSTTKYTLGSYAKVLTGYIAELIKINPLENLVMVAHGTSGAVLQYAAPSLAKLEGVKIVRWVFLAGYVLQEGESIIDNMPSEMAELLENLAEKRGEGRIYLQDIPEFWQANLLSDDSQKAIELLPELKPEPFAPLAEKATGLKEGFFKLDIATAYLHFNHDLSLPQGSFLPRMSSRLKGTRVLTVNGGHLAPLTRPREVAEALAFLSGEE